MATNFPTSVDAFTNPTANDSLNAPSHATQHINSNDAIEAIEGYLLNGTGAAWQSYTPTFTNFTLGNGTITLAKYSQIGKIVNVKVLITLGSTSSVSGRIGISLPVTATSDNTDRAISVCGLIAGGVSSTGFTTIGASTRADLYALLASGTYVTNTNISSTIPGTWTTGNTFSTVFTYEAA